MEVTGTFLDVDDMLLSSVTLSDPVRLDYCERFGQAVPKFALTRSISDIARACAGGSIISGSTTAPVILPPMECHLEVQPRYHAGMLVKTIDPAGNTSGTGGGLSSGAGTNPSFDPVQPLGIDYRVSPSDPADNDEVVALLSGLRLMWLPAASHLTSVVEITIPHSPGSADDLVLLHRANESQQTHQPRYSVECNCSQLEGFESLVADGLTGEQSDTDMLRMEYNRVVTVDTEGDPAVVPRSVLRLQIQP